MFALCKYVRMLFVVSFISIRHFRFSDIGGFHVRNNTLPLVTVPSGAVVSTDITIGDEVGICSTDLPGSCARWQNRSHQQQRRTRNRC